MAPSYYAQLLQLRRAARGFIASAAYHLLACFQHEGGAGLQHAADFQSAIPRAPQPLSPAPHARQCSA
jgi:hypothetical protein